MKSRLSPKSNLGRGSILCLIVFAFSLAGTVTAHPLGNFTINHFTRLEVGPRQVKVRYVLDLAEIPAYQELQTLEPAGGAAPSSAALQAYLERVAPQLAEALWLELDGQRVPLQLAAKNISLPPGVGGLPTLRVECDLIGNFAAPVGGGVHRVRFENRNYNERLGWRELVVQASPGSTIFDSAAFGSALTDELKAYPEEQLAAPLDERRADFALTAGALPAGARALLTREGLPAGPSRDRLAELIAVPELTPTVVLLGLLIAALLGGLHALSPGHGKAVVAAYLVGSRGTARHAAFLGVTVTITHTAGVFALGLVTLFASQYVVPERLFPVLSFISGALVVGIGLSLFLQRLKSLVTGQGIVHSHEGHSHAHQAHSHPDHEPHTHSHLTPEHDHGLDHHSHEPSQELPGDQIGVHSHGGRAHSHLPPGADGTKVTWRNLLALGVSGGLLPCPSALVVMLAAISLQRVGYGLLLVVAFSVGLAAVLMTVGLIFVYAGNWLKGPAGSSKLIRVLPVMSAFIISCLGVGICYQALGQAGWAGSALLSNFALTGELLESGETSLASLGALGILALGLIFGLKHATEADHVIAVSTIVSEQRDLKRAAWVGGLWGVGHTLTLLLVGAVVLALQIAIPESVGSWLEFGVALMIIVLGANALTQVFRHRADVHVHQHQHDGLMHAHIHFHEADTEHTEPVKRGHSHTISQIGLKPIIVGSIHGLAGSAALTLLVLTQIPSIWLGLLYLLLFGVGSIFGMLLMSGLVGLPFVLSARKLTGLHNGLRVTAGVLSIAFGFWYAYDTGIVSLLLTKVW